MDMKEKLNIQTFGAFLEDPAKASEIDEETIYLILSNGSQIRVYALTDPPPPEKGAPALKKG